MFVIKVVYDDQESKFDVVCKFCLSDINLRHWTELPVEYGLTRLFAAGEFSKVTPVVNLVDSVQIYTSKISLGPDCDYSFC